MNDILLTGSRGFIGSRIRKHLTCPYDEVDLKMGFDHCNVTDRVGTLLYFSSWINQQESMDLPEKYIDNNLTGLAELLVNNSFDRVVFPSSSTVYDEKGDLEPISVYALTKLMGEKLVKMYCKKSWILRFANPYGPGDRRTVFWDLARSKMNGETATVYNGKPIIRDYFHVDYIVNIIVKILNNQLEPGTYNVGTGVATDASIFLADLCEKYGIKYRTIKAPDNLLSGYIPTTNLLRAPVLDLEKEWAKYL
jgi:nucleoside-diphosphate-sugar epimerase